MALFTTILGSALLATIANIAVNVALSLALSFAVQALQKKPKIDTEALDFSQTVNRRLQNGIPLEVLTGRRITAGVGHYDNSYSNRRERGVSVTVMSAKPCTAFHQLFLDGEPVTLSGDPTQGEVNVVSHFLGINDTPRVRFRIFLGSDNSGLGEYLNSKFPTQFDANADFGDYCVVVVEARNTNDDFDEDEGENFIPFSGYPDYKVELSGVKVCDPRIAGSVYEDESTYVYSDNAALIDAQYDYGWYSGTGAGRSLIVGNGYPTDLLDIDQIISNADYCFLEGFTCAGVVRSGNSDDQQEIWKTFNADRVEYPSGVVTIPEGHRDSIGTLDLSQFIQSYVGFHDEDGYSTEVYNEIKTIYAEPVEFFGEKDLPIYSNPDWIAADNHIPRQTLLPLLFVTDNVQAGKLQKQEILISRTPATCTIVDLPFNFISVPVGSVLRLIGTDVPAVNDRFWIVKGRSQSVRGDVSLQLREFASDAFPFDELTETPIPFITPPVARPWSEWFTPDDYTPPSLLDNERVVTDANGQIIGIRYIDGSGNEQIRTSDGVANSVLGDDVIDTRNIEFNAISVASTDTITSNIPLNLTPGSEQLLLTVIINKTLDTSELEVNYTIRPRPGRTYFTIFRLLVTRPDGTQFTADSQHWVMPDTVVSGVRTVRQTAVALLDIDVGVQLGTYIVRLFSSYQDGGDPIGFFTTGSHMKVTEVKR